MTSISNIQYHYKALKCCAEDFPYRTAIKSSLAEEHAQRGHQLFKDQAYELAIEEYLKARDQNPEHYTALHQLGLSLWRCNRFEDARNYFQEIINTIQYAPRLFNVKHTQYLEYELNAYLSIVYTHLQENVEGSLRKAEKILNRVNQITLNYRYSFSNDQQQQIHNAIQALKTQESIQTLLKAVHTFMSTKNWVEANKVMTQLRRLAPTHPRVLATEQKLRDAVSTNAYTAFKQTLFSRPVATTSATLDVLPPNPLKPCQAG